MASENKMNEKEWSASSAANEFDEYLKQSDPGRREKAVIWKTAVGLQAVDGLQPSDFLLYQAKQHVEGRTTIEEVRRAVRTYYEQKSGRLSVDKDTEEADKVAANISRLLSQKTLAFNVAGFLQTHKAVFEGVFPFAGEIRTCNITKREWVLRGDTVLYVHCDDIFRGLEYDLDRERRFNYRGLSAEAAIEHLADFTAGLWQIHAFREGNTRTVAVFLIQYLRSMGFDVNNDVFADNSWYFRNSLVRYVYKSMKNGVAQETRFLVQFFRNLLLGETAELKNRYLLINPPEDWKNDAPTSTPQVPSKLPSSSPQEVEMGKGQFATADTNVVRLIAVLGAEERQVAELMQKLGLRDRKNFREVYLGPSIKEGFVRLLYPNSPRHPRQRYLLTVKGLGLLRLLETKGELQ